MATSSEIRQQFIDFFVKKCGHTFVPSSPVVPLEDPTLLFANAGMNQFKPYFLGTEKPPYLRVANTQKCIRAGGKHNDLDDVGKDTYHHTFFEMLGNWSFGDYFKKDAITWAWELLTEVWKLDKERLHVTVFEGDEAAGIPRDDEAAEIWKSVGVLPGHIHLGNKKDNFWEMGATGPCGPCTEIHFDRTPDKSGAKLVNGGSDQCIEIWNNVFIQFNRNEDQSLTPLPAQHVDTGMGFERICAVLNNVPSNYDTDVFTPLFKAIQEVTKARPYTGKLEDLTDTAYRVIADHIRTLTFSITDGAAPGNKGRNAVVRSILRRASRYGWQVLGLKEPFLYKLSGTVVEQLGDVFPELKKNPEKVREVIYDEEKGFLKTLGSGLKRFRNIVGELYISQIVETKWRQNSAIDRKRVSYPDIRETGAIPLPPYIAFLSLPDTDPNQVLHIPEDEASLNLFLQSHCRALNVLSGKDAFYLHSTHGLDKGITQQMAAEAGLTVDMAEYDRLWEEFQHISNAGAKNLVITAVQGTLPKTDDKPKYDTSIIDAKVLGWVKDNTVITTGTLQPGDAVGLLLDRTNFYAEQGGQVGDTGSIDKVETDGVEFRVDNTVRLGETVLHLGVQLSGSIAVGDTVQLVQSTMRRIDIMRNHTATHLLNLALRKVLGGAVDQKGSLVDDGKTRFDFSYGKPLSTEDIRTIEKKVNALITRDLPVTATELPLDEAKQVHGVRAMFGEKYPDPVRVVAIGPDRVQDATHDDSVEFCGGTHMPRTGAIGLFRIVSQEGVAKGVRRVTAVTGRVAAETFAEMTGTLDDLTGTFQCQVMELPTRVATLQDEVKKLKAQLAKFAAQELTSAFDDLVAKALVINGVTVIVGRIPAGSTEQVRNQIDRITKKVKPYAILVGTVEEGDKVPLIAAVSSDLVKKGWKAGDWIKPVAEVVGGKGGGKPDMAQAGGKDPAKLDAALTLALDLAKKQLG